MNTSAFVRPRDVLATGASAGIGEAIARRFAQSGSRVVAPRRIWRLEGLARELGPDRVFPIELDVCEAASAGRGGDVLPAQFSEIACLINDAGLALGLTPAPGAELGDWDRMIDANLPWPCACHARRAAGHAGARSWTCDQSRLCRGRISLSWRKRLRRHQGIRAPVQLEP